MQNNLETICVVFSPSILDFSANFFQKADFQNFYRPNSRDQELQTVKGTALQSTHTYPTSTPNFGQTSNYNLLTTLSLFFAQEFAIGNTFEKNTAELDLVPLRFFL